MTEQEYNLAEGVRRSDLWKMEDSPEKFKYFLDHPEEEKSPALVFGSACHKWVLEKDDFGNEYAVAPEGINRRTKEGKEAWERFCDENAGKEIISREDYETMAGMREVLMKHPLAKKLLTGKGQTEVPLFWTDRETGEKCKVKCDRIVTYRRRKYIIDYKTTAAADTFRFNSSIWKYGYFFQAGMYAEALKVVKRAKKYPGFLFVAQEKKPPYSVNVIEVSEEVMNAGVAKFHQLLEKMHNCKVVDLWPGYNSGDVPNDAFVPGWMMNEMEDEFE